MRYKKPEMEVVEFEELIYTSDYEGLVDSNKPVTDGENPDEWGSGDNTDSGLGD